MCRHLWPFQDYIFVAIPRYPKIIFLRQRRRATQLWGWETVFLQHSFLSPLGNGLAPAFHNNTLLSYFSDYLKCTYFSDDVKCISHLYCAHFSNLQNFHPTAHKLRVIRVEHLRKEFHIPKHLLPSPLFKSFSSFSVVPLSIRSWVSQVCPAAVLDLNQCLYLPDIHTSAAPPNVHTLPAAQ